MKIFWLDLLSAIFVLGGWLETVDAAENDNWDQEYHPKSEHDPLLAAAAKTEHRFLEAADVAAVCDVSGVAVVVFHDVLRRAAAAVVDDAAVAPADAALVELHVAFLRVAPHHVRAVTCWQQQHKWSH